MISDQCSGIRLHSHFFGMVGEGVWRVCEGSSVAHEKSDKIMLEDMVGEKTKVY